MLSGTLSYTLIAIETIQFKAGSAGFGLCFVIVLLESKCIRYREPKLGRN